MKAIWSIAVCGALVVSACDRHPTTTDSASNLRRATPTQTRALRTPVDDNPFGFYTGRWIPGGNGDRLADTLAMNNVGWARTVIHWNLAQPYETTSVANNGIVETVRENAEYLQSVGMKMYVQLRIDAPIWAAPGSAGDNTREHNGPDCDHFSSWQSYVRSVAEALYPLVTHFSIHNEPGKLKPHCQDRYTDYERAAALAALSIKTVNGSNKVIYWEQGGSVDNEPVGSRIPDALASARRVYSRARGWSVDPIDIIGVHVYGGASETQTHAQSGTGPLEEMRLWNNALATDPSLELRNDALWLVEVGGTDFSQAGERGQRDFAAVALSQFIMYRQTEAPRWKKFFVFNDGGERGMTRPLPDDSIEFDTREAFWTLGYLASRFGGDTAIRYWGFAYSNRTWYSNLDNGPVPSVGGLSDLWGAGIEPNWRLKRAGVTICAQYYFQYIEWLHPGAPPIWYCDNERHGPIEFMNQPHDLEAIRVRMQNGLPTYYLGWMQLCGDANVEGIGWSFFQCSDGGSGTQSGVIGTERQGRAIHQYRLYMGGDVR